ncbi:hypothetical protein WA026_002115 [Henosepilachna vigintioctopunctata]|uniref:Uncharacterized protein n=1 Tax=Henosepilachna vigintioctopunctata TaxID=420089 RepID=A0AAW1TTW9_9CUCU
MVGKRIGVAKKSFGPALNRNPRPTSKSWEAAGRHRICHLPCRDLFDSWRAKLIRECSGTLTYDRRLNGTTVHQVSADSYEGGRYSVPLVARHADPLLFLRIRHA